MAIQIDELNVTVLYYPHSLTSFMWIIRISIIQMIGKIEITDILCSFLTFIFQLEVT